MFDSCMYPSHSLTLPVSISLYLYMFFPPFLSSSPNLVCLSRLPVQGVSDEQVLSSEAVLEGQTGQTRQQQHRRRPIQEVTGINCLQVLVFFIHSPGQGNHRVCRILIHPGTNTTDSPNQGLNHY